MACSIMNSLWCLLLIPLLSISSVNTFESRNIWAVLVAGSNSYYNYRHQADLCHAYHVLLEHGVPPKHIIVMMYDDIAYDPSNPRPGVIINSINGSDVYKGVVKDYTQKTVTPENFINIITGNEEKMKGIGSGRVLKSGPNDHVFINFVDHGASGMICFPKANLYADTLLDAIKTMYKKKLYGKLVLYVEACYSGSMFDDKLQDDLNAFVVTAANAHESSYACCYDDSVEAYVGDWFSVNWMNDSEHENLRQETLSQQYKIVRRETTESHVEKFGTLSMGKLPVGEFLGMKKFPKLQLKVRTQSKVAASSNGAAALTKLWSPPLSSTLVSPALDFSSFDVVLSRDVPIALLRKKFERTGNPIERQKLRMKIKQMLKLRRNVDKTMELVMLVVFYDDETHYRLERVMTSKEELNPHIFPCYKKLTTHWFQKCYSPSSSPYSLEKLHILANVCTSNVPTENVIKAMDIICGKISMRSGIQ